jgi:NTE family protein
MRARLALAGLVLASALPSRAEDVPALPERRPRVALALSGGGARGIAHIGVLKAFEEHGIPVDAIAGTSMGAVVGSIYATGRTAQELEKTVKSLDWNSIFSGQPDRRLIPVARREEELRQVAGAGLDGFKIRLPAGVLAEYRVNRFLIESLAPAGYAAGNDFDRLPIPFHAVAAGLDDGARIVLRRGELPRAVRASMSIPLAFPPVTWEGRPLVDGGVVDNLPISEAKAFGPVVVVAVDIASPALEAADWGSAFGVANQVNRLLSERANKEYKAEADVLIRPDLGKHSFTDYTGFDKLIERGYEAAVRALPAIKERLATAGAIPAPPKAPLAGHVLEGAPITEVAVAGNQRYSDNLVRRTFSIPVGPGFDLAKGLNALDRIQATTFFDSVWMRMEPAGDGIRIVLDVKEAAKNRVEVGASYNEEDGPSGFVRFKNRNTLGWGEETDVVVLASSAAEGAFATFSGDRLLTPALGFEVRLRALNEKPRFYETDGTYITRARFIRHDARVGLRHGFKRVWLISADLDTGTVETTGRLGLEFPVGTDDVRLGSVAFVHDSLDDLGYPRTGFRFEARGDRSITDIGADRDYWKAEANLRGALPLGSATVLELDGWAGVSGDDVPAYEQFRLGGPVLLPGYHIDEQWGAQVLAAGLGLRRQIWSGLSAVLRVGAGNVWPRTEDISTEGLRYGASIGLYRPSRIGPLAFDFGVRRGGGTLFSVSVGFP